MLAPKCRQHKKLCETARQAASSHALLLRHSRSLSGFLCSAMVLCYTQNTRLPIPPQKHKKENVHGHGTGYRNLACAHAQTHPQWESSLSLAVALFRSRVLQLWFLFVAQWAAIDIFCCLEIGLKMFSMTSKIVLYLFKLK